MKYILLATMLGAAAANPYMTPGQTFDVTYDTNTYSILISETEVHCAVATNWFRNPSVSENLQRAVCNRIYLDGYAAGHLAGNWKDQPTWYPGGCWVDTSTGAGDGNVVFSRLDFEDDRHFPTAASYCVTNIQAAANPTCDTHTCAAGTNKGAGVECTTGTCDDATCCDPLPTCAEYGCGELLNKASPDACAAGGCTSTECCQPAGTGTRDQIYRADIVMNSEPQRDAWVVDNTCEAIGMIAFKVPDGATFDPGYTRYYINENNAEWKQTTFSTSNGYLKATLNGLSPTFSICVDCKLKHTDSSKAIIDQEYSIALTEDANEAEGRANCGAMGFDPNQNCEETSHPDSNNPNYKAGTCSPLPTQCTQNANNEDCVNGVATGTTDPNDASPCACACDAGYGGDRCETALACTNGANGQACQNGGAASGTTGSCGCTCAAGYDGNNCETALACTNGANGQACQNGGAASGTTGSCGCNCAAGYDGNNCETALACTNGADGNPCQNGATATGTTGSCGCNCVAGFTGDNCETNIDECAPQPCKHGSTCTDGVNSYTCACLPDYTGTNCETIDLQPIDRATRKKCGSLDTHYCEKKGGTFLPEKEHRLCPSTGCDATCCEGITAKTCNNMPNDFCDKRGQRFVADKSINCGVFCTPKQCCRAKATRRACGDANACNYDDGADVEHTAGLCFTCGAHGACDNNNKCDCDQGYGGVACDKKISAFARQSKLTDIRAADREGRKTLVKEYVKDLVRAAKEAGGNVKQILKDNAMAVVKEDLPVTMAAVISKMPRITAMPDNENEEDECATTDAATCGMVDLADDRTDNSQTILEAGDSDGSWTVVVDGTQILSKQTKTGNSYSMQCWQDNAWGTPINKATGETFQCHGRVLFVGSQTGVCDETTCQNGGTCYSSGTGYGCVCTTLWTGDHCELPNDSGNDGTSQSCEDAIKRVDKIAYQNLGCPCDC